MHNETNKLMLGAFEEFIFILFNLECYYYLFKFKLRTTKIQ